MDARDEKRKTTETDSETARKTKGRREQGRGSIVVQREGWRDGEEEEQKGRGEDEHEHEHEGIGGRKGGRDEDQAHLDVRLA